MTKKFIDNSSYIWSSGNTSVNTQYSHNAMNQVSQENSTAITYDTNGNLINKGTRTLIWSAENQLLKVDDIGGTIAEYEYDAMGCRINKDVWGAITNYVMDGGNVIAELNNT